MRDTHLTTSSRNTCLLAQLSRHASKICSIVEFSHRLITFLIIPRCLLHTIQCPCHDARAGESLRRCQRLRTMTACLVRRFNPITFACQHVNGVPMSNHFQRLITFVAACESLLRSKTFACHDSNGALNKSLPQRSLAFLQASVSPFCSRFTESQPPNAALTNRAHHRRKNLETLCLRAWA